MFNLLHGSYAFYEQTVDDLPIAFFSKQLLPYLFTSLSQTSPTE